MWPSAPPQELGQCSAALRARLRRSVQPPVPRRPAPHRLLATPNLDAPRAQRFREGAALEDQRGQRAGMGLDSRVGPLCAPADDFEAPVCNLGVKAVLPEA